MARVVPLRDVMQVVGVRAPAVHERVGAGIRDASPPGVRAVVHTVELAGLREDDVVGVPEPRREDLYGSERIPDRLVLPVVPAEGVVRVEGAGTILVVQGGKVVGRVPDEVEVDRDQRRGERILGEPREVRGRRSLVRVSADHEVERVRPLVEVHAVDGVILLRTRQTSHEVQLIPGRAISREPADDARVRVEREGGRIRVVDLDAGIGRADIENGNGRSAGHEEAGHLARVHAPVHAAVVVVVRDLLDQIDGLGVRDHVVVRAVAQDRIDLDEPVLLGDVELVVRPPLERRGVRGALPHQTARPEADRRRPREALTVEQDRDRGVRAVVIDDEAPVLDSVGERREPDVELSGRPRPEGRQCEIVSEVPVHGQVREGDVVIARLADVGQRDLHRHGRRARLHEPEVDVRGTRVQKPVGHRVEDLDPVHQRVLDPVKELHLKAVVAHDEERLHGAHLVSDVGHDVVVRKEGVSLHRHREDPLAGVGRARPSVREVQTHLVRSRRDREGPEHLGGVRRVPALGLEKIDGGSRRNRSVDGGNREPGGVAHPVVKRRGIPTRVLRPVRPGVDRAHRGTSGIDPVENDLGVGGRREREEGDENEGEDGRRRRREGRRPSTGRSRHGCILQGGVTHPSILKEGRLHVSFPPRRPRASVPIFVDPRQRWPDPPRHGRLGSRRRPARADPLPADGFCSVPFLSSLTESPILAAFGSK